MKKEQIKKQVIDYVQDEACQYALMLTGPWGCGKTYLYNKCLSGEISKIGYGKAKDNQKISLYISLYGISSIESLSKELLSKYWYNVKLKDKEFAKKASKIGTGILEIASKAVSISSESISVSLDSAYSGISNIIKLKNMVICFDDLERCDIPINELFGYINNLIEHCNCKVIILADEENIGRMYVNKDPEKKFLSVISGRKIIIDKKKTDYSFFREPKKSEQKDDEITIEQVKNLCDALYSDDYIYKDIKEKVIGKTLFYCPNLEDIYDDIVSNGKDGVYKTKKYKEWLEIEKKTVIGWFGECECNNIRIVFHWMRSAERLFSIIDSRYSDNKYIKEILTYILKYSAWYFCAKGMHIDIDSESIIGFDLFGQRKTIGYVHWNKNENKSTFGFSFVDDYYDYGEFADELLSRTIEELTNEIKRIWDYSDRNKESGGYAYSKIKNEYFIMSDSELNNCIESMIEEIQGGKYVFQDYQNILLLLSKLCVYDLIDEDMLDNVDKAMLGTISDSKEPFSVSNMISDIFNKEEKQVFQKHYDKISALLKTKEDENYINGTTKEGIYKEGKSFLQFCINNDSRFLIKQSFSKFVNWDALFELMTKGSKKDIYDIIHGFNEVYNTKGLKYPNDRNSLIEFRKRVEKINSKALEDRVGGLAKKQFLQCIDSIINND